MIRFDVLGARASEHSVAPTLVFKLRIRAPAGLRVQSLALQTLIRLEPARRRHEPAEQRSLGELFGDPSGWHRTLQPLLWTELARVVPAFEAESEVELLVPCSYDLEVASTKYFHALRGGSIPLSFLFRGTLFVQTEQGLSVSMLPWDREAGFELPLDTWRQSVDACFPEQGWLRLHREVLDALLELKAARALPSWDAVLLHLLEADRSTGEDLEARAGARS